MREIERGREWGRERERERENLVVQLISIMGPWWEPFQKLLKTIPHFSPPLSGTITNALATLLVSTRSYSPPSAPSPTRAHISADNGQPCWPDGNVCFVHSWRFWTRAWAKVRKSLSAGEKWAQLRNQGYENRKPLFLMLDFTKSRPMRFNL